MGKMTKATRDNIKSIGYGARVKLHPAYGSSTKYFLMYLSEGLCMLSDGKRDLNNGMGYIHSIYNIAAFEAAE